MAADAKRILVLAAIAALIGIWGTTWGAIKVSLAGFPPFAGLGIRFLVAGAVLYALAFAMKLPSERGPRLYRVWVVETIFGLAASYGLAYWAIESAVPSGMTSLLFSTFPLFVALLAHLWLPKEPVRAGELAGIGAAVGGVAILFSDDLALPTDGARQAALVFLTSPVAAAVAHVLIKRWGHGLHPINMVKGPMLATGALAVLVSRLTEAGRALAFDPAPVAALAYLAIPGSVITFTLYYWLLDRVAATRLSLISLGFPVVAVAVGGLFLDEPLTARTGLGAGLVLLGVGLALRGGRVDHATGGDAVAGS